MTLREQYTKRRKVSIFIFAIAIYGLRCALGRIHATALALPFGGQQIAAHLSHELAKGGEGGGLLPPNVFGTPAPTTSSPTAAAREEQDAKRVRLCASGGQAASASLSGGEAAASRVPEFRYQGGDGLGTITFQGRVYVIDEIKKEGSWGIVLLVTSQEPPHDTLAIKLMRRAYVISQDFARRFAGEVDLQQKAAEAGLAPRILSAGCAPFAGTNPFESEGVDDPVNFIVMQRGGKALSKVLAEWYANGKDEEELEKITRAVSNSYREVRDVIKLEMMDISADNVLVQENGDAAIWLIIDFDPESMQPLQQPAAAGDDDVGEEVEEMIQNFIMMYLD